MVGLAETTINANPGCLFRQPPEFLGCAISSGGGISSQLSQCLFKHFWWLAARDQVLVIENDGGHGVDAVAGVEGFGLAHLGGKGIARQNRLACAGSSLTSEAFCSNTLCDAGGEYKEGEFY